MPCNSNVFNGVGNDRRIGRRLNRLSNDISNSGSSVINSCYKTSHDKIAAYRLLGNERYSVDELISSLQESCAANACGMSHVLGIEDTTELDYHRNKGRLLRNDPDIGRGNNLLKYSFFLHPTLAVSATSGNIVGFSSVELFNRPASPEKPIDRHKRPLEEKESFRWLRSAQTTARTLPHDVRKTMLCDREGDVFEVMEGMLACGTDFLIRSKSDRLDTTAGMRLEESMSRVPLAATFKITVRASKEHAGHTAVMELRFKQVSLRNKDGRHLNACCVLAREKASSVPKGSSRISWRLLTSHTISTIEQAIECVRWYRMRWQIEELFRVLKTKGFGIESARLGEGIKLKKLLIITMQASLQIMRMKEALDDTREDVEAGTVLGPEYIKVLEAYDRNFRSESRRNKGNTNPYRKGSLPWAAWVTARLGGWSGYEKAHGRPGRITLCNGFQKLSNAVEFYLITKGT
ncbi:IS4 family transposase [Prevotella sp. PINT]|uniref:IS4 family transposase n=1 Tax=Palleniella intestinalis TaxID=2736291 RepID=UPI001553412B|nr:IS4 family transposase [Palleniella intestinalis]